MRPEHLELLVSASAASVHPDGSWGVVATSRPDFATDSYTGQLWRVPLDGSGARRMTRGSHDAAPQFSPDGRMIGFLRPDEKGKPQVWLLPTELGEAVQVTDQHLGVKEFCFSPDSTRLAFVARVAEHGRYGTIEDVKPGQEDARLLTGLQFHANGLGYTTDRRTQLFTVEVPDLFAEPALKPTGRAADDKDAPPTELIPAATRLTENGFDVGGIGFTPDGRAIVGVSARHEDADTDLVSDLYSYPVDGGEPTRLTDGTRSVHDACFAGDHLFVLAGEVGQSRRDFVGQNPGVYLLRDGSLQRLTDAETMSMTSLEPADDAVLSIEDTRGRSRVHRIHADGTDDVVLDIGVTSAAVAVPGSADIVVTRGDLADVMLVKDDGIVVPLTDLNAALADFVEPTELTVESADGYPVHGWVLTPQGDGPHPTLLMIHGGPFSSYHEGFFDEAQVYVEAGYGIVMCNPRGSSGYGQAHGKAIKGDFGNLDMADVLAFLDGALEAHPELDRERIGIMGGSYGGYLTAWIIAHDHRWKGAIVERGFLDPASFTGASDIGWFFQQEYNTTDRARQDAQSPMLLTDQVTTPTLVIHSEQDIRCPIAQGYRYYTQLKLAGVEAQMLAFPGENHELSRSGTPHHRRQRFEHILRWWSEHLG